MAPKPSVLLLGLATLSSAMTCTRSASKDFDDYIVDHLPNLGNSGGGSSSSSSSGTDWIDIGHDAVNDVGFRKRADDLECTGNEVCLYQDKYDALLCYDQNKATYQYDTGMTVDIASGAYTTPDGEKGNFSNGPCVGDDFVEAEDGEGCTQVSVTGGSSSTTGGDDSDDDSDSDDSSDDDGGDSAGSAVGASRVLLAVVVAATAMSWF